MITSPQMCYDHPLCYYIAVHHVEILPNTRRQAGVNNWLQSRCAYFTSLNLLQCVSLCHHFCLFRMTPNVPAQRKLMFKESHVHISACGPLYKDIILTNSLNFYREVRMEYIILYCHFLPQVSLCTSHINITYSELRFESLNKQLITNSCI